MTFSEASRSIRIRWDNAECFVDDAQHLYFDFPINPHEFLSIAERDLTATDEVQALVNGLTNAKRAIDSQVDRVLSALGFSINHKSFKKRFDILRQTGIVAPRIIRKVRDTRNVLEHEYNCPVRKDVEDALDIATLFVLAVDRVFLLFPLDIIVYNEEDENEDEGCFPKNCLMIQFKNEHEPPFFEVILKQDSKNEVPIPIRPKNNFYILIARLFIAIQREADVDGAKRAIASEIKEMPQ